MNFYLGDNQIKEYLEKIIGIKLYLSDFDGRRVPESLKEANSLIVQVEMMPGRDLYKGITCLLPRLLLFEYIPKPILMVGFQKGNDLTECFDLPISSRLFEYFELPVLDGNLIRTKQEATVEFSDHELWELCENYFKNKSVDLCSKLDHDFNKKQSPFATYKDEKCYKDRLGEFRYAY